MEHNAYGIMLFYIRQGNFRGFCVIVAVGKCRPGRGAGTAAAKGSGGEATKRRSDGRRRDVGLSPWPSREGAPMSSWHANRAVDQHGVQSPNPANLRGLFFASWLLCG